MTGDALSTALVDLLRGAHGALAEDLPGTVEMAARALGVTGAGLYLVELGSTGLARWTSDVESRSTVPLDGTAAGRAFRSLRPQSEVVDGRTRLWVPVVVGRDRLGVLDLPLPAEVEAADPALLERASWFAHAVGGHLAVMSAAGDGMDRVRRNRRRTVAAELIWQQLPPLTAGTSRVEVAGALEPSESVGGDVFDYAVSPGSLDLAIIDATGHDLAAGLASTLALAAYRNARRQDAGLLEQVEAVSAAVAGHAPTFATGVFARLDLATGELRYVSAGHPYPVVLRDGVVVATLTEGRRTLLGRSERDPSVGQAALLPGDVLVLFTDGIVDARDAHGSTWGMAGLTEFFVATSHDAPLAEVARLLCAAVRGRQKGVLRDDTTVLMARWAPDP